MTPRTTARRVRRTWSSFWDGFRLGRQKAELAELVNEIRRESPVLRKFFGIEKAT